MRDEEVKNLKFDFSWITLMNTEEDRQMNTEEDSTWINMIKEIVCQDLANKAK